MTIAKGLGWNGEEKISAKTNGIGLEPAVNRDDYVRLVWWWEGGEGYSGFRKAGARRASKHPDLRGMAGSL